jgi:prepilin-type N-terminal cleavage/methylation domain-containing protein
MNGCKHKTGVTLVEILIVVAIIAILTTIAISIAAHIDNQSKRQLAQGTIEILTNALEQFHDYGYNYNPPYSEFDFPLDCSGFYLVELETTLGYAPGLDVGSVSISGAHDPNYSGSEALCFFLNRVPESRKTLDKIDSSLIVSDGLITTTSGGKYPLLRIIDPWGKTLHYDYYDETSIPPDPDSKRTFPVISSAGPDRIFGTTDDITSK